MAAGTEGMGTQTVCRITVVGVGGAGGNAVNNMISANLEGVDFIVANTDGQALAQSLCDRHLRLGRAITQGLGAGGKSDIGRAAAEEVIDEIIEEIKGSHMLFVAAGMGGGTGSGATPVIARAAREQGILTVGVVTKPFQFEGAQRTRVADQGVQELQEYVDTLIVIPNQNLFRIANENTTFADAFKMADDVLYCGVRGITDLIVNPGVVNLDFSDIRSIMSEMGKAMMGTGEAEGEKRALDAAEAAISNPLLDEISMKGARAVLVNITGGLDIKLYEVDEAAQRIKAEVDEDANIIWGSALDTEMEGRMRVSVVATGMDAAAASMSPSRQAPQTVAQQPAFMQPAEKPMPRPAPARPAAQAAPATAGLSGGNAAPAPKSADEAQSAAQLAAALSERKAVDAARRAAASTEIDQRDPRAPARAQPPRQAAAAPANTAMPAPQPQPRPAMDAAPAAPASARDDSFIAPPPARPATKRPPAAAANPGRQPAAEGMARAETDEAARSKPRQSLFERVVGGTRNPTAPAAGVGGVETRRPSEVPAQQRLGGLEPTDRPAQAPGEDGLLEIPAFLRRQAN